MVRSVGVADPICCFCCAAPTMESIEKPSLADLFAVDTMAADEGKIDMVSLARVIAMSNDGNTH